MIPLSSRRLHLWVTSVIDPQLPSLEGWPVQNRTPFVSLVSSLVLAVLLDAQHSVANIEFENGMASASKVNESIQPGKAKSATLEKYARLPLSFEPSGDSGFMARSQDYTVDIRGPRVTIALAPSGTVWMEFLNGRPTDVVPDRQLPGKINYLLGRDSRGWRLGVPTYERVTHHELYPGIDVVYHGSQEQLEFDFALKPWADPRLIRMRFSGGAKPTTDSSGSLVLGEVRLNAPVAIQGKNRISAGYKLLGNDEVGFELGAYDRRQVLVIDPTLVYATRLGGGNGFNQGSAIALDLSGNAYITGYTSASDFPVVNAAYAGYQANADSFISKINAAGTALVYSTYIGGSGFDYLRGIAVDSAGAAWAVGYTFSSDFPLLSPIQDHLAGTSDAVVLKLSPGGALAYSTFLGGSFGDSATAVAVDPFGNAYITGGATVGFPTSGGVYQPIHQGSSDAFVTKLSSTGSMVWSTFVGGSGFDQGTGIAADSFGNSYITGGTFSTAFPGAPPGGAQPASRGGEDAFVAKLNFNASAPIYFTFLGGSGADSGQSLAVDPISGIAVVAGDTTSLDLATSTGALQSANAGGYDGFVAKLNTEGSAFLYTTYLGGNRRDILLGVAIDPKGDAYVAGYTDSSTFPTNAAIQPAIQGSSTSLFRTSDAGVTWTPFDTNLSGAALGLSPDPVSAGTVIVSTNNGTYRTTDGGSTWTQQTSVGYMTLARSLANASTIYGSTGSPIYQSTDNGTTWSFKGSLPGCCAGGIVADPVDVGTAYVFNGFSGLLPGVLKTTNNGANWTPAVTGLPETAIVTTVVAGSDGSLYAGLDHRPGLSPGGVYRSRDHGTTWQAINSGLPTFSVPLHGLAVAGSDPSVVYVTDYYTLYKSTNGGTSWSRIGLLPGATWSLAVSGTDSSTLYYAASYSPAVMWVSTNSGAAWSPATGVALPAGLKGILIVSDPLNGTQAYAQAWISVLPVVAKLDATGQQLVYSTFLGDYGAAYGIATNGTGDALVTGSTWQLPTTSSALQRNRSYYLNKLDGFIVRISDATAPCSYSVDPSQSLELWFPHVVQYVVTAPSGCSWTASSDQPWATIADGVSGSGSGIVFVLVENDETPGTRVATLTIAGQTITLGQRPGSCGYNVFSPDTAVVPGGGGTFDLTLIAGAACDWTMTNNDPTAVTIVAGSSGTGNGTVTITVAPNLGPNTRTFVIGSPQGGSLTITQAGTVAPAVVATITSSPSGAEITSIGTGCIPGTYRTPASLTWNANTNCTISFTSPQAIGGSQYVFNSASVNGSTSTTSNPLTVNSGSSPLAVHADFMSPCTYSLSPSAQAFPAAGGLGSFAVNSAPACSWTPVPSASWISILPSAFKGPGRVNYAIAPNGSGSRTGTISVAGQPYTVDQEGPRCSFSIAPAVAAFDNGGATARVVVTAPAGCGWMATSNAGWMSVTSGASGNGTAAVVITAAANSGGPRSGTVTIAGLTFSVRQGADACGAVDVTSRVRVVLGFLRWCSPVNPIYCQTISLTNTSEAAIPGPVYLVMLGQPHLSGCGIFGGYHCSSLLSPRPPLTHCFSAEGDYLLPFPGDLQPHATVSLDVAWIIEYLANNAFRPKVLSGAPSR